MKRHLLAATVISIAMAGTARAQAPEGAPPAVPPADPTAAPPTAAAAAPADDVAARFGHQGQIALLMELDDSDINMRSNVSFIHTSQTMGGSSSNTFSLSPTGHYFVTPNVSVSAGPVIMHGSIPVGGGLGSATATALGILVGAGYDLHLAPMLSAWPQAQIGYIHESVTVGGVDATGSMIPLQISIPVLFHPAEHFFLGLGPIFRTQLSNSLSVMGMSMDQPKQTDIGVTAVIGGYFGG